MMTVFLFQIGFLKINWNDIADVALVSVLIYNVYKLMQGTLAMRVFFGLLMLYFSFLFVQATQMELLTAILGQFMGVGVIAGIILFQQEIRKFLLLLGDSADFQELANNILGINTKSNHELSIHELIDALQKMSRTQTGALIVVAKKNDLSRFVETGDLIDAEISSRLVQSLFFKNSPMHDGAMIIQNNRIKAARCILPVSENQDIPATMGLRHRAGIGISEVEDVLVLLVSEETGKVSIAQKGEVFYNLVLHEVQDRILQFIHANNKDIHEEISS